MSWSENQRGVIDIQPESRDKKMSIKFSLQYQNIKLVQDHMLDKYFYMN